MRIDPEHSIKHAQTLIVVVKGASVKRHSLVLRIEGSQNTVGIQGRQTMMQLREAVCAGTSNNRSLPGRSNVR